ncbi:thioesterase family protein [Veillonella sp. R32]|uniref:thioesterase family protein n=1 Tax=Veillonella sp. R32 TaxID=2021312 RepID=UPI00138A0173|nr:thioesterase family protein [Veillonella sp. R32]KAF1682147.1 dihydrolipoamide acyltransferase [Veillonella sp. R32]
MSIQVGLRGEAVVKVTEANIAKTMKSGALPVFATPAMCALMEEAAVAALSNYLADGEGTVGISLHITHDKPSPVGATIRAEADVTAVEGRKISYRVAAYEGEVCIGQGTHERFVINNEKFMSKLK